MALFVEVLAANHAGEVFYWGLILGFQKLHTIPYLLALFLAWVGDVRAALVQSPYLLPAVTFPCHDALFSSESPHKLLLP